MRRILSISLFLATLLTIAPAASASTMYDNSTNLYSTNSTNTGGYAYPSSNSSPQSAQGTYAALGDSVAAGLGLNKLDQCGRSQQAYPYIVAAKMNLKLLHIACSGATAGDLITKQGVSGPSITAQLDQAFASGTPSLITITAGANDVHYADFLRACYQSDCATSTYQIAAESLTALVGPKLALAMQEIQNKSNGNPPEVVVTGYYNPISNYCKGRQSYATDNEIEFLNQARDRLNQAIREAIAPYSFAKYASTNFTGHALCASDPWIQGLSDPAPIHPNAKGQQHIADSVLNALGAQ